MDGRKLNRVIYKTFTMGYVLFIVELDGYVLNKLLCTATLSLYISLNMSGCTMYDLFIYCL